MNESTLPGRLRLAREMAGLSALGLSRLAGLPSGSHVGLIESSRRPNPTVDTLIPIAAVLGVSLDWLVSGEGEPPEPAAVRAAVEAARSTVTPDDIGTHRICDCPKNGTEG